MDLVALENNYFLVRFYSKEDYEFARDQRPWTILDHYLVVKEWAPDFDPLTGKTEKLIVWVRIPCLPIEYFDFTFLKKVGEKIGKPIRADQNTGTATRGRFARLCVEVDITKPLLTMFEVRKRNRRIEYEGIHLVCFQCGIVGHCTDECSKPGPENPSEMEKNVGDHEGVAVNGEVYTRKAQVWKQNRDKINGDAAFGPWMLAKRKEAKNGKQRYGRNASRENQDNREKRYAALNKKDQTPDGIEVNSRFNALYGLEEEVGDLGLQAQEKPTMDSNPRTREAHIGGKQWRKIKEN